MVNSKLMEVMEILQDHDIRTDDLKQKTDDGVEVIEALLTWEDNHKSDKDFIGSSMKFLSQHITLPDELLAKYLANDSKPTKAVVEKVEAELEQEESKKTLKLNWRSSWKWFPKNIPNWLMKSLKTQLLTL